MMKKIIFIFTLGIVLIASPFMDFRDFGKAKNPEINPTQKQELRVMSYNIHHANPPSKKGVIELEAVIRTIKKENPDLVALQEIDVNTERSGKGNQAQVIGDALGMHVFFGRSIDFETGEYGVAVLSKFPITDAKVQRLRTDSTTNGEPRILATVKVRLLDGREVRFGSTHLDSQKEDINRLLQIEDIIELTDKESLPLIIGGDFNATSGSPVINLLDSRFNRTCISCAPTIPANSPTKAIDFIAFRRNSEILIMDHHVIGQVRASDHLPVLAVLGI